MKEFIIRAIDIWFDYHLNITVVKRDFWHSLGAKWFRIMIINRKDETIL